MKWYEKFKVGDKVRILTYATMVGVESEDVGKVGTISDVVDDYSTRYGIMVKMNEVCIARECIPSWSIGSKMCELLPKKGEQLLFNFMSVE